MSPCADAAIFSLPEVPVPLEYDWLTELWEAAVRHTHHFLREEAIVALRQQVRDVYLPAVRLVVVRREDGLAVGFMGYDATMVQMLFVHPRYTGRGVGRRLLDYALGKNIRRVDVNEQNPSALAFYQHVGFVVVGRSKTDAQGNPYPLLHLEARL